MNPKTALAPQFSQLSQAEALSFRDRLIARLVWTCQMTEAEAEAAFDFEFARFYGDPPNRTNEARAYFEQLPFNRDNYDQKDDTVYYQFLDLAPYL